MTIGDADLSEFRPAKRRVKVSVGDSVRIVRELQDSVRINLPNSLALPGPPADLGD